MSDWVKEFHGARDWGMRRDDDLAYVGKSSSNKFWRAYVRLNLDDPFRLLSREGWVDHKRAMADADAWVDARVAVAA